MQPNRPDPESGESIVPTEIRSLFPEFLCQKNHHDVFKLLLWLEELAMEYANYSTPFMSAQLMVLVAILYDYLTRSPCGYRSMAILTSKPGYGIAGLAVDLRFYSLPVPGLAEKRPSVIIGQYFYYVRYVT